MVLIMGEFIGFVWVISRGNSLLSALRRSNTEWSAGFIDTASRVQANVGALFMEKTSLTIKARGVIDTSILG